MNGLETVDSFTQISIVLIMPTLQLTQSEANLLQDLFSTIADLDLNETTENSDSETFDSLWDKVTKL